MAEIKKIKKVMKFMEKLDESQYNFKYTVKDHNGKVGTVCDFIGWMASVFPKDIKWSLDKEVPCDSTVTYNGCGWYVMIGVSYLGLSMTHSECLFTPNLQSRLGFDNLGHDSTKEDFLVMMDKYLKKYT